MAEVHFNSSYLFMIMVSFIVSVLVTPLIRFIALKYNFVDKPTSDRKVHRKAIPTLGGIALWLGFNAGMGVGFFLVPELTNVFIGQFIGLSAALLIICATGIYDDIYNLKAHIKLIIQIGVAVLLIRFGFEIELISKLFGDGSLPLGILSTVITAIWIVGMMNAINLLDGLDGLASGVCGIALFFLCIAAIQINALIVAILCLSLIGAIIGFLFFNFYPAKIFMGNVGSMFLGLMLAVITIKGAQKQTTIFTLFVPVMAMALPLLDTFLSIMRRIWKKQPIFKADRGHIHHRLLNTEGSQRKVVLSLYFMTACFGMIALSFSGLKGISAIVALIIVSIVTYRWLKSWGFLDFLKDDRV